MQAIAYHDFYKADHRRQFPKGTTKVYSNFTARGSRVPGVDYVVSFGLQYFIKRYLQQEFDETFFKLPKGQAVGAYKRRLDSALGPGAVPMDHIAELHELGFLPLHIKALPEGTVVPVQVPLLTVTNTDQRFFWLPNFIETMLSATLWPMCTSATIAFKYRQNFERYARETGAPLAFVPWQGHDFSMRGMFGIEAAAMSGAAHLLSFTGTDTIPAIDFLEKWYGADSDRELIGGSVPATEHAVMCSGGSSPEAELETYRRLLTEVYPTGIVSIVSDTWDFWRVVDEVLPKLKDVILARNGKLVIRPDSGDPVRILCGDPGAVGSARFGLIHRLYQIFGGTQNAEAYTELDPHIGAIYGDSITLERQVQILEGLKKNGFASSNVVLGIGSYTYQHVTRDTFGFAMKATYCEVNGEEREIFKAPKTDASKASARGLIAVNRDENGELFARYPVSKADERESVGPNTNLLEPVFNERVLQRGRTTLKKIRARIEAELFRERF